MRNVLFATLAVLAFSLFSFGQDDKPGQWKADGKPAENTSDHKAVNGFGAHLIVVQNPKEFVEMWQRPETPRFTSAKEVGYEETLGVIILFAGCTADDQGACNTEVDYLIYKPDDSILADRKNQPLWKEVAPPKNYTQLGRAILVFKTARSLPTGQYKVKARVSDLNAKTSFDLETKFSIK